jgi:hypothetical protein
MHWHVGKRAHPAPVGLAAGRDVEGSARAGVRKHFAGFAIPSINKQPLLDADYRRAESLVKYSATKRRTRRTAGLRWLRCAEAGLIIPL